MRTLRILAVVSLGLLACPTVAQTANVAAGTLRTDATGKYLGREFFLVDLTSTVYGGRTYYSWQASYQDTNKKFAFSYSARTVTIAGNTMTITANCQFTSTGDSLIVTITKGLVPSIRFVIKNLAGTVILDKSSGPNAPLDNQAQVTFAPTNSTALP